MPHPILVLDKAIAECVFRVAPAKAAELDAFVAAKDLNVAYTEDRKFSIRVNLATHEIKLPIATLNYLWCSTYFFYTLYTAYVAEQGKGPVTLNMAANPTLNAAVELFNWSSKAMRAGDFTWPQGKPRPAVNVSPGSPVHMTNEMFLSALAWILHHERAHVELDHSHITSRDNVKQEIEADLSATKWVMHGCPTELDRQKRALGIVIAVFAMMFQDDPHEPESEVGTHPPAAERLFRNLELAKLSSENVVFAFCTVLLQFFMAQYGLAPSADAAGGSLENRYLDFLVQYRTRHR